MCHISRRPGITPLPPLPQNQQEQHMNIPVSWDGFSQDGVSTQTHKHMKVAPVFLFPSIIRDLGLLGTALESRASFTS